MPTQLEKFEMFKALHEQDGAFVIPNPWDIGSARLFEGLGFKALATTSSGFAYTLGRLDGQVTLEEKLAHCRALADATSIPVSADLENGFADDPETAASNIALAAQTGIVSGSIEDYDGSQIYDFNLAVERVQATVEKLKSLDVPFSLTARAENVLRRHLDLDEAIKRLQAFEKAGADVLYAPGLRTLEEVKLVATAVSKPINVLVTFMKSTDVTLEALAEAGAKRISIGGTMASVAYGALLEGGKEMINHGQFQWRTGAAAGKDIGKILGTGD
ncbi:MAG: isocitrate lyase/phosphoenolpyruvate mutase family protein [Chloroflexota bacterium]